MKQGVIYYVAKCGDNRRDGLDHGGHDIHYLRTVQKAIDKIVYKQVKKDDA